MLCGALLLMGATKAQFAVNNGFIQPIETEKESGRLSFYENSDNSIKLQGKFNIFGDELNYNKGLLFLKGQDSLIHQHNTTLINARNEQSLLAQVEIVSGWIGRWKVGYFTALPVNNAGTAITAEEGAQKLAANGGSFMITAFNPWYFGWNRHRNYNHHLGLLARAGIDVPALGGYTNELKGYFTAGFDGGIDLYNNQNSLSIQLRGRFMGMVAHKEYREFLGLSDHYFHTVAQAGVMFTSFKRYGVLLNFNTRNQNHNILDWTRITPTVGLNVALGK